MRPAPPTSPPTATEMLWASIDSAGGFAVMFLPLLLLAFPGIVLFVILPALVLGLAALPLVIVAALLALPFQLNRAVRRVKLRRRPRKSRPGLRILAH